MNKELIENVIYSRIKKEKRTYKKTIECKYEKSTCEQTPLRRKLIEKRIE